MAISGVVYSIGDWIAQVFSWLTKMCAYLGHIVFINTSATSNQILQCYEGKPLFEFDRTRLFRSGLAGFALHGSLSHYYYQLCEVIIMPVWVES